MNCYYCNKLLLKVRLLKDWKYVKRFWHDAHLKPSLMTFLEKKSSKPSSSFPMMLFGSASCGAEPAVDSRWKRRTDQLFDDEFTLKAQNKSQTSIPAVDLGMLETYVWPSGFRPLGFWPGFGVMFQSFVLHGRQLGQRGRFCVLWSRGRGEVFIVRWRSVQLWRRRKRRVLDVDRYLFQSFVEVKLQLWQTKAEGSKASWEFQKDKSRSNKSNSTAAGPHAKMLCYILW